VSVLGSLIRVDEAELDEIRGVGGVRQLTGHADQLDLGRDWDAVGYLLERGGAPVNPVRGGSDFPDSTREWSWDGPARCLDPVQVRSLSTFLRAAPYQALERYLADTATDRPSLYPANRDWRAPDTARQLGEVFGRLAEFLMAAAARSQYVIFIAN
jgi:hypothetical protein